MFRYVFIYLLLTALLTVCIDSVQAQTDQRQPIPNVYLDCQRCNFSYIRTNISMVNYVRDQDDADIYLRITDARTGSGREYTLDFRGIPPFSTRRDTLIYVSPSTDSSDEERAELARYIKIGLVPFVTHTIAMRNLNILYEPPDEGIEAEEEIEDPWNSWVFDVSVRSSLSGKETENNFGLYSGFFAERITEDWKIRTRVRGEINRRSIELSEGTSHINRDWGEYWGLYAYSINDHASVGLYSRVNFSRTGNINFNIEASPAIEYNFFPYGEYQERRFLLRYHITPSYTNYFETTVFLKDSEFILQQVLSTRLRYDQPWGRIDISVSGSNYFHDTSINRLEFNPSFNIRIIRGLSVSISGRYRLINDQISLPAGDISDEDRLTGARQQATSYDYSVSFGLSYTFGSIYSNIVNSRF
ncbi:MAG: hypothetical protein WD510_02885 [Balneolaceae bacterium]